MAGVLATADQHSDRKQLPMVAGKTASRGQIKRLQVTGNGEERPGCHTGYGDRNRGDSTGLYIVRLQLVDLRKELIMYQME
jgi:hypothetical protein